MSAFTRCLQRLAGDFATAVRQPALAEKLWTNAAIDQLTERTRKDILHLSDPAVQERHIFEMDYSRASDTPPKKLHFTAPVCGLIFNSHLLSQDAQEKLASAVRPLEALAANCGVNASGQIVKQGEPYTVKLPYEGGSTVEHDFYRPAHVQMTLAR